MKPILIILFAMSAAATAAQAKGLLNLSLDTFGSASPICPPPKEDGFKDANTAKIAYVQATRAKRPCAAAEAALFLAREDEGTDSENATWAARAVQAFTQNGDFHQATVQGLRLLNSLAGQPDPIDPEAAPAIESDIGIESPETAIIAGLDPAELEPLRLAVVEAVYSACLKLGIDRDVTWRNWALTLHPPGSDNERSLSLLAYLEDFSQSPNAQKVRAQATQLMNLSIEAELAISRELAKSGKTYAALSRLEYLYRYPQLADTDEFQNIVEEIIALQDRLIVELPGMRDQQIRDMLHADRNAKIRPAQIQRDVRNRLCKIYPIWRELGKKWEPSTRAKAILKNRCR